MGHAEDKQREAAHIEEQVFFHFRHVRHAEVDAWARKVEIYFEDLTLVKAEYLVRVDGKVIFTNLEKDSDGARWKPLCEADGYWIGDDGRILGPMGIRKLSPGTGGFLQVVIRTNANRKRSFFPHLEVAEHFIGRMGSDYKVVHINGIITDNRSSNLEWALNDTDKKAKADHRGRGPRRGISASTKEEIKELYADGYGHTQEDLAKRFHIPRSAVSSIVGPTRHRRKTPLALV